MGKINKWLICFSLVLFTINSLLVIKLSIFPVTWLLVMYILFFSITFFILHYFEKVCVKNIEKAGFFFMAMLLVKIVVLAAFLHLFDKIVNYNNSFLFNLSITYLAYLFASMFLALKTLKPYQ